jgi:hypothetical protein
MKNQLATAISLIALSSSLVADNTNVNAGEDVTATGTPIKYTNGVVLPSYRNTLQSSVALTGAGNSDALRELKGTAKNETLSLNADTKTEHLGVTLDGTSYEMRVAGYRSDNRFDLSHYFIVGVDDDRDWGYVTVLASGEFLVTLNVDGSIKTLLNTSASALSASTPIGLPFERTTLPGPLAKLAARRHAQIVGLSARGVVNHQVLYQSGRMLFVAGGDLGQMAENLGVDKYFESVSDLFVGGAGSDIRQLRDETFNGVRTVYAQQYLNGVPVEGNEIQVEVRVADDSVLSVTGVVFSADDAADFDPTITAKQAQNSVLKALPRGASVDAARWSGEPKLVWISGKDGLRLHWVGDVRGPGIGFQRFTVDAQTGSVSLQSNVLDATRVGTCDAQGDEFVGECTGMNGAYPWVKYEDSDNDMQCNSGNPSVTAAMCSEERFVDPYTTIDAMEPFWEAELGNNCCDLSGGFINAVVRGSIDDRTNPHYAGNSQKTIYFPTDSGARSKDVAAHESMHALMDVRSNAVFSQANTDSVAGAINEGYADANAAIYKGSWTLYNDWSESGNVNLGSPKRFSDHSTNNAVHTNGRIVSNILYRIATGSGGTNAKAKTILLKSLNKLNKGRDGNAFSWSYEDLRLSMIEGVSGNQSLITLINSAFDAMAQAGSGGGGGCALATPSPVTAQIVQQCGQLFGTIWRITWQDSCVSKTTYYDFEYTGPGSSNLIDVFPPGLTKDVEVFNSSGNIRVRACGDFYCSPYATSPFLNDQC